MKYPKTAGGNAPYLVEDGRAYFSVRLAPGKYREIVVYESDYRLAGGQWADYAISKGVSL